MPIYNGMLPVINKDEVKRYAGLRHAEDFPEKFVDEACKEIQLLATPKGVYQEYDYDAENKVILSNPPLKIEGSIIEKHLEKSTKVYEVINNIAKKQGYAPTWRFSPGYGNWPLEIQPELGKIIKTEQIGLQVTENYLLFPRKSVTAIIGLMPGDQCLTTKRGCSSCSQKDCQSRKLPEKAATPKPETSKTTAETSGISMKAQPTE